MTARDMAQRFAHGGTLVAFGSGAAATDAHHVASDFLHPAIAGKRALPAIALANDSQARPFADAVGVLGRSTDIAFAISNENQREVVDALTVARDAGMLTVHLQGGHLQGGEDQARIAECTIAIPSVGEPPAMEIAVVVSHLLWELVHVLIDGDAVMGSDGGGRPDATGPSIVHGELRSFRFGAPDEDMLEDVARSKIAELEELYVTCARTYQDRIEACALFMADRFARHGRLFVFGNGGSATALANEENVEVVFAYPTATDARPYDMAWGLSASGNARAVVAGLEEASACDMLTIAFAGDDGAAMAKSNAIDLLFVVPSSSAHRIQETQSALTHVLWECIKIAMERRRPQRDGAPSI